MNSCKFFRCFFLPLNNISLSVCLKILYTQLFLNDPKDACIIYDNPRTTSAYNAYPKTARIAKKYSTKLEIVEKLQYMCTSCD